MLIEKQKGYFILGGPRDVCKVCAEKKGVTITLAKRMPEFVGALQGKPIHRVNSEYCECLSCIEEAINDFKQEENQ